MFDELKMKYLVEILFLNEYVLEQIIMKVFRVRLLFQIDNRD